MIVLTYVALAWAVFKIFRIPVNAESVWRRSRDGHDVLGQVWSGPFDVEAAGTQSSAMDLLVAAVVVGRESGDAGR